MLIYLLTHSVKTNVSIANCVSRTVVFTRGDAKMKTLTHTDTSRPQVAVWKLKLVHISRDIRNYCITQKVINVMGEQSIRCHQLNGCVV